ncbi:MAG: hypothetical protein U0930_09025 [Pirellulales bacterium]
MASLRWIAGFACLLSILAFAIADQQGQQKDSLPDQSDSQQNRSENSGQLSPTPSSSTRFVSIKLYDETSAGTNVLACPTVKAGVGQRFSIASSESSSSNGFNISGRVGDCYDGIAPLSLTFATVSNTGEQSSVQRAQSESLQFEFEIEVPGSKTLELNAGRKCEVIVR